jgi:hypothetical protein
MKLKKDKWEADRTRVYTAYNVYFIILYLSAGGYTVA